MDPIESMHPIAPIETPEISEATITPEPPTPEAPPPTKKKNCQRTG